MNKFTITSASKMGEPDPQYGQSYWANAQGVDTPLMFSTNKEVQEGATISCEESVNKTSKKGQEYLLLRKVSVEVPGFPSDTKPAESTATKTTKSYGARDDSAIKAQWAIGRAVELTNSGQIKHEDIEPQAMDLFAMVDRVKVGGVEEPVEQVAKVFDGADQIEIPSDN